MHTARQLKPDLFSFAIGAKPASIDEVLPDWQTCDRFGVVIDETLGALGASLLIQAATSQFFDAVPGRRDTNPQYPEIYAFHLGWRHGDLSAFDFWPPRKEVLVGDGDDLLGAINDRAITRLAVPQGQQPERDHPLYWADIASARDRLRQCFLYSPEGRTRKADVQISALSSGLESNPDRSIDLEARIRGNNELSSEQRRRLTPGPVTEQEIAAGVAHIETHRGEVSNADIARVTARRAAVQVNGLTTETYGLLQPDAALRLLGMEPERGIRK